jgi:CRP/FNR family transcriptional regulator, cyclic AMP receptor protein
MSELISALRGVEFFEGFADEHLKRVAAISQHVEFPAHHVIFHEDERAKEVYVILSGRVSLVYCAPRVGCRQLMEVGPGELVGWSPLVGRARLSDSAQTLTPTAAIAMDGERILALCEENPRFGFEFMHRAAQTLASRVNATREQLFKLNGALLPEVQLESD